MMRTIKYAETAIFLAVISASACAIGEECGWRRVCEVPETQIEWEETPSHVRSLSRLVGALDIGLSNGLPASDFGRIKELARALDHDPDKCYRYVRDNEVRVTIEVPYGVFSSPAKVQPYVLPNGYTLPGGGMERIAPGHLDVPVRIINVLEY